MCLKKNCFSSNSCTEQALERNYI